jgi:hypothetical protein
LKLLTGLVLLLVVCAASAQETLFVRAPAMLAPDAPIAQAVLRECNVEDRIATNAYDGIRRTYRGPVRIARGSERERELHLTMLDVTGVGPGPWTRKAITLRADLMERERVIVSAVFERETGGNIVGPALRSACTTLGMVAVLLGKQIGLWANSAMASLPADSAVPRAVTAPGTRTAVELRAAERLETLKKLFDEGMISGAEYEQKRGEILKDL